MDAHPLSQSLRDAADNSIANADVKFIATSRYVKKALNEIVELFPDDCTKEVKKNIVEYLLHQAAKKIGDDPKKFNLIPPIYDVKDLGYLYTTNHDVSDLTTSEDWQSRYGSVVWAKHSKSDPWWPSYICDPRLIYPGTAEDIRDFSASNLGKKYLVYYYGEASKNKYGFANLTNIRDYFGSRVEFETQATETKTKTLQRALPLADSEAIRDVGLRIAWVQYLHEINLEVTRLRKKSKSSSSKKKETENLNSESLDSFDEYSASFKKNSRLLPQKKRNIEIIDSNDRRELSIEIPAKKKANVYKTSDSHGNDAGTSGKQREYDDSIGKRKNRLISNKETVDSPTEILSDSEGRNDQAAKSPIKKKAKTDYSDDDLEEDGVRYIKDVVELDFVSNKSHKRKAGVRSGESDSAAESARAKHAAKVSRNSKSLSSASLDDDEDGSDSAGNSHAAASKKRGRPSRTSEPFIPDEEEEEEELADGEEAEQVEEEYEEEECDEDEVISMPKKKGRKPLYPTGKRKPVDATKPKKKAEMRVVIDLAVTDTLDEDSDVSPRSLNVRFSNRRSDVSVSVSSSRGKGSALPGRSRGQGKMLASEVSVSSKDAAKGSKGRHLRSLSTDSSDQGDVEGGNAPLRRSSRVGVHYEENENVELNDEENDEEDDGEEESLETSGVIEVMRDQKAGKSKKPVKPQVAGKRGRPPGRSGSGSQLFQDNRKMNRKGSKDDDADNNESKEGEDYEAVGKGKRLVDGIQEEVAAVEPKIPLNETLSERLGRLLRRLVANTKVGAVQHLEKAIITMDKIENLVLTMDELKESGAAERISVLRKHPNAAIAAKAKQLRAKWMEAARRSVILAASSAESATVDAEIKPDSAILEGPAHVRQSGADSLMQSSASSGTSVLSSTTGVTQAHVSASDLELFDDTIEPTVQQEYKNGQSYTCSMISCS